MVIERVIANQGSEDVNAGQMNVASSANKDECIQLFVSVLFSENIKGENVLMAKSIPKVC